MLCIQCGEDLVPSGSIATSPSGTSVITEEVTPPLCPATKPCGGDKSSPPPPGHKVAMLAYSHAPLRPPGQIPEDLGKME